MGADHSLTVSELPRKSVSGASSSLPASPERDFRRNVPFGQLSAAGKSFSMSVVESSHFLSFKNQSITADRHHHDYQSGSAAPKSHVASPSFRDNNSLFISRNPPASTSGIVVVRPGPSVNYRSSSSLDISAQDSNADPAVAQTRRLRHLPVFHPLIPSSSTADFTPTGVGRVYCPTLPQLTPEHFIQIASRFREHLEQSVDTVERKQVEIIGLQNKIDYEVTRLWTFLQTRELGIPPTTGKSFPEVGTVSNIRSGSSAGKKQVDTIVLHTSQISGLIDQCKTLICKLANSLQQVNAALPPERQLPPLKSPFIT